MLYENIQLDDDEQVLRVVRRHWFILASELFGIIMLALIPVGILLAFQFIPANMDTLDGIRPGAYPALVSYLITGWSTICVMLGFAAWTHYYLDLWVITDRRIIVIDQRGFFSRNVSSFRLERLQDIEFYVQGILATFLKFGTIKMQTASAFESNFQTRGLPDPRGLQSLIQEAMDRRLAVLNHGQSFE